MALGLLLLSLPACEHAASQSTFPAEDKSGVDDSVGDASPLKDADVLYAVDESNAEGALMSMGSLNDAPDDNSSQNAFSFNLNQTYEDKNSSQGNKTCPSYPEYFYDPGFQRDLSFFYDMTLYFQGYLSLGVGVVGIACNILSLTVWQSSYMKETPSKLYLSALAICDMTASFMVTLFLSFDTVYTNHAGHNEFQLFLHKYHLYPCMYISLTSSVFIVTALSVDRAIGVNWPLKYSQTCTRKRTLVVIWGLVLYSFVYSLPEFFAREAVEVGGTTYIFATDFAESYFYKTIFIRIISRILLTAIPMIIMLGANVSIVVALRRNTAKIDKNRSTPSTASEKHNRKISILVIAITCFTFFNRCTEAIMLTLEETSDYNMSQLIVVTDRPFMISLFVNNFYTLLNSTANFFFYCTVGSSFRKALFRIYRLDKITKKLFTRKESA